ncbi:MAG: hypothetical protein AABX11_04345 [Nanoarchaeota archaeon]
MIKERFGANQLKDAVGIVLTTFQNYTLGKTPQSDLTSAIDSFANLWESDNARFYRTCLANLLSATDNSQPFFGIQGNPSFVTLMFAGNQLVLRSKIRRYDDVLELASRVKTSLDFVHLVEQDGTGSGVNTLESYVR